MFEGKKISELDLATSLQDASCFPVVNNGVTKRVTFATIVSHIESQLPESEIGELKEDVLQLKTHATKSEQKINTLETSFDDLHNQFETVDEMVQGQNATIRNCVSTVNDLNETIAQTHFDDVLELEEQVRTNEVNIERNTNAIETKQNKLNDTQLQAVNSGITAEKVAQYDEGINLQSIFDMNHPIGEPYVQFPNMPDPNTLYQGRGIWTEITSDYAGLFFRAAGGSAEEFGTTQAEGLPNIKTGDITTSDWGGIETSLTGAWTGHKGDSKTNVANGTTATEFIFHFDASKSNSIYGNSTHVTPVNTAIRIWKRTA